VCERHADSEPGDGLLWLVDGERQTVVGEQTERKQRGGGGFVEGGADAPVPIAGQRDPAIGE